MDPADRMALEALHNKVSELEADLGEKEQNMVKAALFGKSLLEENNDLRTRIDDLMKQHAADLEVNYSSFEWLTIPLSYGS